MIKNNKGVTLIELLIVIVVMGIIAAFAVPAVGTIIENTNQDAVVADAIQLENAANLYCAQTTCTDTQELKWQDLDPYVDGIKIGDYTITTGTITADPADTGTVIATKATEGWSIELTLKSKDDGGVGYGYGPAVPSQGAGRASVN